MSLITVSGHLKDPSGNAIAGSGPANLDSQAPLVTVPIVPAQVVGYLIINVAGTAMKVPYYNT